MPGAHIRSAVPARCCTVAVGVGAAPARLVDLRQLPTDPITMSHQMISMAAVRRLAAVVALLACCLLASRRGVAAATIGASPAEVVNPNRNQFVVFTLFLRGNCSATLAARPNLPNRLRAAAVADVKMQLTARQTGSANLSATLASVRALGSTCKNATVRPGALDVGAQARLRLWGRVRSAAGAGVWGEGHSSRCGGGAQLAVPCHGHRCRPRTHARTQDPKTGGQVSGIMLAVLYKGVSNTGVRDLMVGAARRCICERDNCTSVWPSVYAVVEPSGLLVLYTSACKRGGEGKGRGGGRRGPFVAAAHRVPSDDRGPGSAVGCRQRRRCPAFQAGRQAGTQSRVSRRTDGIAPRGVAWRAEAWRAVA